MVTAEPATIASAATAADILTRRRRTVETGLIDRCRRTFTPRPWTLNPSPSNDGYRPGLRPKRLLTLKVADARALLSDGLQVVAERAGAACGPVR
jgi:hypothetical protein